MNKFWFKAKNYGWGWYPATWEGWLVLIAWLTAMLFIFHDINTVSHSTGDLINGFLVPLVLMAGALGIVLWKMGERPSWRWAGRSMPWYVVVAKLLLVVGIGFAVAGAFAFWQSQKNGNEPIFCTQEAKLCPDGSYVGRTGPKCEFAPCPIVQAQRTVSLFYYNASKDTDATGNVQCSRQGLVEVRRTIPVTQTPIQDTIRLLLEGALTVQERAQGITTEYPLPGFQLRAASLRDGVLTLTFDDPQNATNGGSCRVGILWFQIEATARQFLDVRDVRFQPEELFQP